MEYVVSLGIVVFFVTEPGVSLLDLVCMDYNVFGKKSWFFFFWARIPVLF